MSQEFIHVHKNRLNRKINLLLLLLPPIAFAIIVAGVVSAYQKNYSTLNQQISILGEQAP